MRFAENSLLGVLLVISLAACGDITDDLVPSGHDRRSPVEVGTTGPEVGQIAPDFTVPDSFGDPYGLSESLTYNRGVVLYFTMWCPVCDSHLSHMRDAVIPRFAGIEFVAVDYVSGSVADVRSAQEAHGFGGTAIRVLADLDDVVEILYEGTMGTTVVIGADGMVRMNEDYRNGARLVEVLTELDQP